MIMRRFVTDAMISSAPLQFRHIALEGPIGVGKTALAERLGARLEATVMHEETDNPFLADFYADRRGAPGSALLPAQSTLGSSSRCVRPISSAR
jgi:hypothetical protein